MPTHAPIGLFPAPATSRSGGVAFLLHRLAPMVSRSPSTWPGATLPNRRASAWTPTFCPVYVD
eukprot:6053262-Lingulodinium_polyedra.AAC.1